MKKNAAFIHDIVLFNNFNKTILGKAAFTKKEILYHFRELCKMPPPITVFSFMEYVTSIGITLDYHRINKYNRDDVDLITFLYTEGLLKLEHIEAAFIPRYIIYGCPKLLADNPSLLTKKYAKPCILRRKHVVGSMLDAFRNSNMSALICMILEYTGYDMNSKGYDDLYIKCKYESICMLRYYGSPSDSDSDPESDTDSDMPDLLPIMNINIPGYIHYDSDYDDDEYYSQFVSPDVELHEEYNYHRNSEYDIS